MQPETVNNAQSKKISRLIFQHDSGIHNGT